MAETIAPADAPKWYGAFHGGAAFVHHSGADTRGAVGARFGRRFFDRVDFGLLILRSGSKDNATGIEASELFVMISGDYFFDQLPGLYLGGRLGPVGRAVKVPGLGDIDATSFGMGLGGGYDYPIKRWLWLGVAADWLYAPKTEKTVTSNGAKVTTRFVGTGFTHLLGVLKVRF